MRNALIVLLVFALVLVGVGAVSHSITFDIEYGLGAYRDVSAFWIMVVVAVVFFVAGLVAAGFARASGATGRRKVEAELQSVYQRLREAEAGQKQAAARLSTCEEALAEATAEHAPVPAGDEPAATT